MSPSERGTILVVAAHPDDETLGAGGTIRKHVEADVSVDVYCMTGNNTRNKELKAACGILGVRNLYLSERDDFAIDTDLTKEVVGAILKSRPDIVITHHPGDYNRNHRICAEIVNEAAEWASHVTVFENAHRVERIYNMEINSLITHPNVLMDISDTYERALAALREHGSQTDKANSFYEKLYDARTKLRGIQSMTSRAEAFTVTNLQHAGPFYKANSVESLL
ncbi:PIG-L family deacetylase [Candidatus Thorarchaeota archaeon]|nr:MAG: PIG-L family deacetylase [Candidatus Thorarchaeota archaeon]